MKTKIEIDITKISVWSSDKKNGTYEIEYASKVNGKQKKGRYASDYSSQTADAIRGKLKRGYAVQLAVGQLFGF